jgi:hypothetical protein
LRAQPNRQSSTSAGTTSLTSRPRTSGVTIHLNVRNHLQEIQ